MGGRAWTDADEDFLINNRHKGAVYCAKKLNRSIKALHAKGFRLGLGGYVKNSEYLTGQDIADITGIGIKRVLKWIKSGLIKHKKLPISRGMYLVKLNDLEDFLKSNQDLWDSRNFKAALWRTKPNWFKEKINKDKCKTLIKKWSPAEKQKLLSMHYSRQYTNKQIGEALGRSEKAIECKISKLRISSKVRPPTFEKWTKKEMQKAITMFKTQKYTYEQIGKELGRSRHSIEGFIRRQKKKGALLSQTVGNGV